MYQSPQTNINEYLKDELNIQFYKLLKNDPNWQGLFEPLEFFNILYQVFEIFNSNHHLYAEIESGFDEFKFEGKERYFLLYALINVIDRIYPDDIFLIEPVIGHSIEYVRGLYYEAEAAVFPKTNEPTMNGGESQELNELSAYMLNYDKNWYYNPSNISNQILVLEAVSFIENERKGEFITIDFLNLMYWHYKQLFKHVDKPFDYIDNYKKLPLSEVQKHLLLCIVLKWCGGIPFNRFDNDYTYTLVKLLETEFLQQFDGNETPEKKFITRGVTYSIFPSEFEFWDIDNKLIADLPTKKTEVKPVQKEEYVKEEYLQIDFNGFSKNQIVLIFYYFFENLKIYKTVDKSTIARFIHLITKEKFTKIDTSDIYKRILKAPESNKPTQTLKDLNAIKSFFENVGLNEIVKTIENDFHKVNNGK